MMSARLLRVANGRGANIGGAEPRSRSGFYGRIDRVYMRVLALGPGAPAWWWPGWPLLVMASSVPLYKLVRQEYLPSNVDEGEFDVRVTAPEGTSLAAMNRVALQVEEELRADSRRAPGAGYRRERLPGRCQWRQLLRPACPPHAERTFRWGRLLALAPWNAFPRQLLPARRPAGNSPPPAQIRRTSASAVRNPQTFVGGGPTLTSISRCSGRTSTC